MATILGPSAAPAGARAPGPVFERIVCAVDGSDGSAAAVDAAIALAPCSGGLSFVAIAAPAAGGPFAGERRARLALEQAQALAAERGTDSATTLVVSEGDVAGELVERCGPGTLLVAGSRGDSPLRGGLMGSVASSLALIAPGPLLIARGQGPACTPPRRMLVAVDDSPGATAIVRRAGALAAACDAFVHLVHVSGRSYGPLTRHRLAELSTDLIALTGAEPIVDIERGRHVAARIEDLASRCDADLVVIGRGGPQGTRALGSVSEQIVHAAPCSVLLLALSC